MPGRVFLKFPSVGSIIRAVAANPGSFFFDSSDAGHSHSRYSYAGIGARKIVSGNGNPFGVGAIHESPLPLVAGYIAFENYAFLDPFNQKELTPGPIPGHWFGTFPSVLVMDHAEKKAWVEGEDAEEYLKKWEKALNCHSRGSKRESIMGPGGFPPKAAGMTAAPTFYSFQNKISRIKNYLTEGDCYQINLTERYHAKTSLSAAELYQNLRTASPAPYGAFLNAGDFQILSASPELFLKIENGIIETRPIKGTRGRAVPSSELTSSEKDKAELLMIIDLERNDLGKICETGSVKAEPLFALESFAQVHHLVSTVTGKLKAGITPWEALAAIFPGGSVTGAPKIRALQIIKELEEKPRSVYTGALGFFGNGEAQFNLPIRTMTVVKEDVFFHAGCGIVMDSDPEKEFEEMQVKASGMLKALGL